MSAYCALRRMKPRAEMISGSVGKQNTESMLVMDKKQLSVDNWRLEF